LESWFSTGDAALTVHMTIQPQTISDRHLSHLHNHFQSRQMTELS